MPALTNKKKKDEEEEGREEDTGTKEDTDPKTKSSFVLFLVSVLPRPPKETEQTDRQTDRPTGEKETTAATGEKY